jgi:hypothetical protein
MTLRVIEFPKLPTETDDAESALTEALGLGLTGVVILGFDADGDIWRTITVNDPDALWLLEQAKHAILNGEHLDDE